MVLLTSGLSSLKGRSDFCKKNFLKKFQTSLKREVFLLQIYMKANTQTLQKVAIFDSGRGGLSVFNELKAMLSQSGLNVKLKYFCDTENFPYGTKTQEQLKQIMTQNVCKMVKAGYKTIIIACNTASIAASAIYPHLEQIYKVKIIKVTDWLKYIDKNTVNLPQRIVVIATHFTTKAAYYPIELKTIAPETICFAVEMQNLVSYIEESNSEGVKKELYSLSKKVKAYNANALLLGCTHYSVIKSNLNEQLPNTVLFDPSYYCALITIKWLQSNVQEAFTFEVL